MRLSDYKRLYIFVGLRDYIFVWMTFYAIFVLTSCWVILAVVVALILDGIFSSMTNGFPCVSSPVMDSCKARKFTSLIDQSLRLCVLEYDAYRLLRDGSSSLSRVLEWFSWMAVNAFQTMGLLGCSAGEEREQLFCLVFSRLRCPTAELSFDWLV